MNYASSESVQIEIYEVYDSAGKRLSLGKTQTSTGQIDLKLSPGLYFIRWMLTDGSVKHSRIVLE